MSDRKSNKRILPPPLKLKRISPQVVFITDFDTIFAQHFNCFGILQNQGWFQELELLSGILLVDNANFSSIVLAEAFENSDECVSNFSNNFVVMVSKKYQLFSMIDNFQEIHSVTFLNAVT